VIRPRPGMPLAPARKAQARGRSERRRPAVVDVHSHFMPERFLQALMRDGAAHGTRVEERDGERIWWSSPHQAARIGPIFYDVPSRLEALDRWRIRLQALSLSPPMLYWAPPALGRDLARTFNEEVEAVCRADPDRFIPLATLPLQDVAAALAETERAARAGCRGVYVGTNVNGRYLDAPEFVPLLELCDRLALPVFIHPLNNAGEDRMTKWHLGNSVGNPGETALAAARLIMSGTLERLPRLRFVLAHGGGSLPFIAARMDHAYAVRPECRDAIPHRPSTYLPRMYYDTITHGDEALRFLIEAVGVDRVVLGSDYPYDMADAAPVRRVSRLKLAAADEAAIDGENARRLLRLNAGG